MAVFLKKMTMKITVNTRIVADMATVWQAWNTPADIKQWNAASRDWHTTDSQVDLRVGGGFSARMAAKDDSMAFDFAGTYTQVIEHELIEYTMADGRVVSVVFQAIDGAVAISETFDAETQNDAEMQRQGWQCILDNFAQYVASKNNI